VDDQRKIVFQKLFSKEYISYLNKYKNFTIYRTGFTAIWFHLGKIFHYLNLLWINGSKTITETVSFSKKLKPLFEKEGIEKGGFEILPSTLDI
jgi:hypothetical protein